MVALGRLSLVELPVVVEVAAAAERAQAQHGLRPLETPPRPGDVHPVLDEVAARALDHAACDREPGGQGAIVAHEGPVLDQVTGALIDRLALGGVEVPAGGSAAHAPGHAVGLAFQQYGHAFGDPSFHLGGAVQENHVALVFLSYLFVLDQSKPEDTAGTTLIRLVNQPVAISAIPVVRTLRTLKPERRQRKQHVHPIPISANSA